LRTLFSVYGKVGTVTLVKDRDTGEARGFAFLEMPDTENAQAAIRSLDNLLLNGYPLRVNEARDKQGKSTDSNPAPRRDHRRHRF
jgi:RNA recognition motif-containing protein